MTEELPESPFEVITITVDRSNGDVELNFEGLNYLEAIGVLTVAMNQLQDLPYFCEHSEEDNGESV